MKKMPLTCSRSRSVLSLEYTSTKGMGIHAKCDDLCMSIDTIYKEN